MNAVPNAVQEVPPPRGVILIVEDEIELSRLFSEVIRGAGFEVVAAYSVTDALSTLNDQHFDAAILDIELRDGSVFPVADKLTASHTPFIFASAVYSQMVPKQYQATPFVAKPFHLQDLLARVEAAVAGDGE